MNDSFNLARFVGAQDACGTYADALAELRNGRKVSHWMWFVFPQLAGLGRSATARHFAISGMEEARAYLAHEVLGPRLLEVTEVVAALEDLTVEHIFGSVDAMKLQSSMTLFTEAASERVGIPFRQVLDLYFDGRPDAATMQLISTTN